MSFSWFSFDAFRIYNNIIGIKAPGVAEDSHLRHPGPTTPFLPRSTQSFWYGIGGLVPSRHCLSALPLFITFPNRAIRVIPPQNDSVWGLDRGKQSGMGVGDVLSPLSAAPLPHTDMHCAFLCWSGCRCCAAVSQVILNVT